MKRNQSSISKGKTYEEIGRFWDEHDLSDFWDQTEPVEIEVDLQESMMYYPLNETLSKRLQEAAKAKGIAPRDLLAAWIEEKLQEV